MTRSEFIRPSDISKMSESQVRKLYSEYRSIANKRINRLTEQGLDRGRNKFATIKEIAASDRKSYQSALADVVTFLRSDKTTVTGQKKFLSDFRSMMESKGYGDLVKTNADIYSVIDFMESMREQYSDKIFDSGDALDVLKESQRLRIPKEKVIKYFDEFAINLSELEKVKPSRNGKEFSQRRIRTLINKWTK